MKGLAIIGIIFMLILSVIIDGMILVILWNWFIVSLFSLPALTIPYAIGISSIISYLRPYTKSDSNKKSSITELIGVTIAKSVLFLLFGYIIHLFI